MDKYLKLIFLFVISSLGFYNPNQILDPTVIKFIFYVIAVICIVFAFNCNKYNNINIFKNKVTKNAYYSILLGIIISVLLVPLFNKQSLIISVQAVLYRWFAYAFLFVLIRFNPPVDKVEKLLVVMGFLGIFVNGINMLTAPNCLFGNQQEEIDISRGFVRVRTPIIYICFLFFYSLSRFKYERKKVWGLTCMLAYMFIVFWVARQYILYCAILGFLFYLSNISILKKILISLLLLFITQYVLLKLPFIQNFIEMTQEQSENADNDIRMRAWMFYLDELQTNDVTRILGNGIPSMGNSVYGNEFEKKISTYYVYASDVGWIGFYFYHGLLALSGLCILFVSAIFRKHQTRYKYISYLIFLFVLTSFAGGAIIIPEEITALMLFIYIALKTISPQKG